MVSMSVCVKTIAVVVDEKRRRSGACSMQL